ncbi:MAG: protease modulator HflC [Xanthomonadales bacterium]|nr:protease modulator HflC [Xanthomonadales bacterium]MCB1629239.1 protease modulator HflC [Xanthomonadales bacterium]MCB1634215.1 protease modulator HflC [Xanthomonadales bacterium]
MKHLIAAGIVVAVLLLFSSFFTVREDQYAVLFRLGEITRSDFKPGLHFKTPLVNNVLYFDRRVLSLDSTPERFITSEKKDVTVDSVVKWRISDVGTYYTATRGDELRANQALSQIIKDRMRDEFNKRTLQAVVADARSTMMATLRDKANEVARDLGIEIIDVRIKRIELPDQVTESVFDRMRSERKRVASELRSQGREAAEKLQAEADRTVQVLLAEAEREAQEIRGDGDAQAAAIYAQAYNKDPDFYEYLRRQELYRESIGNGKDVMVLDHDSPLLKDLGEATRR